MEIRSGTVSLNFHLKHSASRFMELPVDLPTNGRAVHSLVVGQQLALAHPEKGSIGFQVESWDQPKALNHLLEGDRERALQTQRIEPRELDGSASQTLRRRVAVAASGVHFRVGDCVQ
jgi:hypothetical protein